MPSLLKRKVDCDSDDGEDDDGYDETEPHNCKSDDNDEDKVAMFEA
mgnify:CR=1 FL=1